MCSRRSRHLVSPWPVKVASYRKWTEINPIWLKLVGWPVKSMFVDSLDVFDDNLALADRAWFEIRDRFDADGR